VTSYQTTHGDPTDVVGRRIAAYGIDLVFIAGILLAILIPMFLDAAVEAPSGTIRCSGDSNGQSLNLEQDFGTTLDSSSRTSVGPALCFDNGSTVRYIARGDESSFTSKVYLIAFTVQALNLVLLQGLVGASVGKLLLGLRVVREDGHIAGVGWAFLRYILLFIDSLCCFMPGAVLVFTTKGHRRIGDMAASTFVVARSSVGSPLRVPGVTAPAGGAFYPGAWPGSPGGTQASAPGWNPAAGPTTQSSPWSPAPQTPQAPPAASDSGDGPTWDPNRNAYIQYDRQTGAWLQWDDQLRIWGPIDQ